MRHDEVVLAQDEISEEKDVEVEGTRTVAETGRAVAAEFELDREQLLEQFARGKIGFQSDDCVEEARLISKADRRGGVKRRTGDNTTELREAIRGCGKRCLRRTGRTGKVGAEAYIGNGHGSRVSRQRYSSRSACMG